MLEKSIGHLKKDFKVVVHIDKTKHAQIRQDRHDEEITDEQIKSVVDKAAKRIIHMLVFDDLNIKDKVLVHQVSDNLNVLGQILQEDTKIIRFEVITVLREKKFRTSSPIIHVS